MTHHQFNTNTSLPSGLEPPPTATGPLLVATTGSSGADAAVIAARLFNERTGAQVQVLTVVAPVALGYTMGIMPLSREIDVGQRDAQLNATREQLLRLAGADCDWPVSAEFGEPSQAISDAAEMRSARLIIVGHGHHSSAQRLLGGDHVLQALQLGDTPVFAAAPQLMILPRRVVIATDFSDLSAYAAQVALSFVASDASIYLVNVMPDVEATGGGWEHDWAESYRRGLADAFNTAKNALHREALTIEPVTLTGNAGEETIRFAAASNADLIVCGTHGHGFLRRLILGSVATKLIRNAPCSVLCVPGSARQRAGSRSIRRSDTATRAYAMAEWNKALHEFSRRNEGRLCTIEIEHAAMGAQIQGTSIPFIAANYDDNANVAELMFGERTLVGRHFSNTIPGVTSIDVEVDESGADESLKVANSNGRTVITFAAAVRFEDERDNY